MADFSERADPRDPTTEDSGYGRETNGRKGWREVFVADRPKRRRIQDRSSGRSPYRRLEGAGDIKDNSRSSRWKGFLAAPERCPSCWSNRDATLCGDQ